MFTDRCCGNKSYELSRGSEDRDTGLLGKELKPFEIAVTAVEPGLLVQLLCNSRKETERRPVSGARIRVASLANGACGLFSVLVLALMRGWWQLYASGYTHVLNSCSC
jgi:hypothetical protein